MFLKILTEVVVDNGMAWLDPIIAFFSSVGGIVGTSIGTIGVSAVAILKTILPASKSVVFLQDKINSLKEVEATAEAKLVKVQSEFNQYKAQTNEVLVALLGSSPNAQLRGLTSKFKLTEEKTQAIGETFKEVAEAVVSISKTTKKLKKK